MYDIGLNANATMKSIHKKSNPLIIFEITICINVFEFISKCNQDKRIGWIRKCYLIFILLEI